jgi:hypothetical protein
MPEAQREKPYFSLRKGLNTVSNEITFPEEYTSDELNYTIESDGSRRRRRGLAEEASGSTKTVVTIADGQVNQSFKWQAAGGDPAENLIVHQVGYTLYFSTDGEIASVYKGQAIDLSEPERLVDSATTAATVGGEPCSFSVHRGYLVVTHKYLDPFHVTWSGTVFTSESIQLLYRDFEGIDDGVGVTTEPTGAIDADHKYNLRNRGWKQADMDSYFNDLAKHPAKNATWYKGYKRTYAATVSHLDGARSWDSTKQDAEVFGNSSAAQGSLLLDPTDTTSAAIAPAGGDAISITAPGSFQTGSGTAGGTIRLTVTGHSRSAGDAITISGCGWTYRDTAVPANVYLWNYNGAYTLNNPASTPNAAGEASIVDANTIDIYIPIISSVFSNFVASLYDGQLDGGATVAKSDGVALSVGPSVCETFMGRIWYAGIERQEYADTIFFSQISQTTKTFGYCFQDADPTDEFNNQLRHSDGGTLIIPNMGQIIQLKAVRNVLLVFATNGVWEISGGGRSPFTASNVSVRQITDAGCSSPLSVTPLESSTIYTSPKGVIALAPNQYTSLLEASNMTAPVIEDTWNAIPATDQKNVQTAYDDAKKRLYVLYRDGATLTHTYNKALVYDIKNQGWYRLGFNYGAAAGIISMFAITDADSSESNQKMKFQCQITTTTVDTCDMNQTAYLDFDGAESPLPYLVTGWEASYGFQRRKQAPIVSVFNKRTGTGWTDSNGWTEDNGGSTLMTPFWDWTEAKQWDVPALPTAQEDWDATASNYGVSGKIGRQVETYRFVRNFTPLSSSDVDGYPVIATRNKVRGRGRTLSMRFDGAATKDSHLLGFTINYKITRKK